MQFNQLLSWIGWYYLPGKLAGWLLSTYYGVTIRAGDPKPQPGSPRYARHWRNSFILVIALYFLYTIYEADWELQRQGNFYADLGVPIDVTEKALQSRFRKLTVQYHPDKISDPSLREAASAYFVHLKLARDTLIDPAKRFAYDRFGIDMLSWKRCTTVREYVMTAINNAVVHYVASCVGLVGATMLGLIRPTGRYWRYLILGSLAIVEFTAITSPTSPSVLTNFVNPLVTFFGVRQAYLPFQFLSILRRAALSSFIAVSQVSPVLAITSRGASADSAQTEMMQAKQLDQLEANLGNIAVQAKMMFEVEMAPFKANKAAKRDLEDKFREWIVQDAVRMNPEVRDQFEQVMVDRRRSRRK
jgi:hypothetical protein